MSLNALLKIFQKPQSEKDAFAPALLKAETCFHKKAWDEAEKRYRALLAAQPDQAEALNGLGRVLHKREKLEEAQEVFRHLLALKPDQPEVLWNLGMVLCESGKLEESFALFRRHADMTYTADAGNVPAAKAQHDREQCVYLNKEAPPATLPFHIETCGRVAGRAVNADPSAGETVNQWQHNKPQIIVIDHLLSEEALTRLRRFCLDSTIWRTAYEGGYLGATPEHGLGSPLFAQIADELRSTYPSIFANHPLIQFWGFKYDSRLSGIAVHADAAAVNVNFWITPDEANLDPESGGLLIWEARAPKEWEFAKYNDDVDAVRNFLTQSGAKPTKIPYRCNRAVIFNSALFHETDRISFKEGYINRRINLTLLYGRRESAR